MNTTSHLKLLADILSGNGKGTKLLAKQKKDAQFTAASPAGQVRLLCADSPETARPLLASDDQPLESAEINDFIDLISRLSSDGCDLIDELDRLNKILANRTYLVLDKLTVADLAVAGYLNESSQLGSDRLDGLVHVRRWLRFVLDRCSMKGGNDDMEKAVDEARRFQESRTGSAAASKPFFPAEFLSKRNWQVVISQLLSWKEQGQFVQLPGAERNKVVVRFPPEASGYLHIGHAKAALLNQHYQRSFDGQLIMRFDDTNPEKENAEFERVILDDVQMLGIRYDRFSRTSDFFQLILEKCEQLLKSGKAYVDDTEPEKMKQEREQRIESSRRSASIDDNLRLWEEMKAGTPTGLRCCVRAKIDMSSPNGCLRDPTIYRCKVEPHLTTGSKFKVYPTYDLACPIVDSVEGVTHALRTTEYHDRDEQYSWMLDALELRKPFIYEYSRLNLQNTVLSKRKLTWFVEQGLVEGWNDPRMPTVRGVLRRGMTVEALREFIVAQGSSRNVNQMEWDKLWAVNKKVVDPSVPRFTCIPLNEKVPVYIEGLPPNYETEMLVAAHPKMAEVGQKWVFFGERLVIDREDAECFTIGSDVTFINWGNFTVIRIKEQPLVQASGDVKTHVLSVTVKANLSNRDFRKTQKVTWLADRNDVGAPIAVTCVYFDHLISKPVLDKDEDFKQYVNYSSRREQQLLGDPELRHLRAGEIVQIQRRGFFICDRPYQPADVHICTAVPLLLFHVPEGKTKAMPTAGLKDSSKTPASTGQTGSDKPAPPLVKGGSSSSPAADETISRKKQKKEQEKAKKSAETAKAEIPSADAKAIELDRAIRAQGEKVRQSKLAAAGKELIDDQVKTLLELKQQFKQHTGVDWKPTLTISADGPPAGQEKSSSSDDGKTAELDQAIRAQGDKVRQAKAAGADKAVIDAEVKILLDLKQQFKQLSGIDWKPTLTVAGGDTAATSMPMAGSSESQKSPASAKGSKKSQKKQPPAKPTEEAWKKLPGVAELNEKILAQGNRIRQMKTEKAGKDQLKPEVDQLLALKAEFKTASQGIEWTPKIGETF